MCTITIDPASIAATALFGVDATVTLSGTVSGCTSNQVRVTADCSGFGQAWTDAVVTGGTWTATMITKCGCGTLTTFTATCRDTVPCSVTYSTPLNCGCCPRVETQVNPGEYNSDGQQLVTFVTTLTFPPGCVVQVRRDFGDGTYGGTQTFSASPATYQETHPYTAGSSFSSQLVVLSHADCGNPPDGVNVSDPPPGCATNSLWAAVCKLLRFTFLVFGAAAGVLYVASPSLVCNPPTAFPATAVATGSLLTALVLLALLYFLCRKCICGFLVKLLGQLFVAMGAVLIMLVLSPNCAQPWPFVTPIYALAATLFFLLLGGAALLYATWYQNLRTVCPVSICDYWSAISESLTVALVAALLVYSTVSFSVSFINLAFDLLAISILLILSNQLIVINQNAGKC